MRRWLLILMLVLLPLRGWVGEAMAGEMLQQHAMPVASHAHAPAAGHAHHGHDAAHAAHHCGQHASPAAPDTPHAGHGPTCASCQACSSVALGPTPFAPEPARFAHPRPASPPAAFTSAEPALTFKPPRG